MANPQLTSYSTEKSESISSKIRNKTRMSTLVLWILFHPKHKRLKFKKTSKISLLSLLELLFGSLVSFIEFENMSQNSKHHCLAFLAKLSPEVFEALTVGSYPFILSPLLRKMKKCLYSRKKLYLPPNIFLFFIQVLSLMCTLMYRPMRI